MKPKCKPGAPSSTGSNGGAWWPLFPPLFINGRGSRLPPLLTVRGSRCLLLLTTPPVIYLFYRAAMHTFPCLIRRASTRFTHRCDHGDAALPHLRPPPGGGEIQVGTRTGGHEKWRERWGHPGPRSSHPTTPSPLNDPAGLELVTAWSHHACAGGGITSRGCVADRCARVTGFAFRRVLSLSPLFWPRHRASPTRLPNATARRRHRQSRARRSGRLSDRPT